MIRFVNQSIKYGIFGEGFQKIPYSIKSNYFLRFSCRIFDRYNTRNLFNNRIVRTADIFPSIH